VDQLLFGTILFTLVTFLFPTVLAYYALFAVVSWESLTNAVNSFYFLDATLYHIALREYGNVAGFHEPFPSVCVGTPSERSMATAWFDFRPYSLHALTGLLTGDIYFQNSSTPFSNGPVLIAKVVKLPILPVANC
jgi:hypothetical protein